MNATLTYSARLNVFSLSLPPVVYADLRSTGDDIRTQADLHGRNVINSMLSKAKKNAICTPNPVVEHYILVPGVVTGTLLAVLGTLIFTAVRASSGGNRGDSSNSNIGSKTNRNNNKSSRSSSTYHDGDDELLLERGLDFASTNSKSSSLANGINDDDLGGGIGLDNLFASQNYNSSTRSSPSMLQDPRIPLSYKVWSLTLLLLSAIVFAVGEIGWTRPAGAPVVLSLGTHPNGTGTVSLEPLYYLSCFGSIKDLWTAEVYVLSIFIAVTNGTVSQIQELRSCRESSRGH